MNALVALLIWFGCNNNTDLAKPSPSPKPLVVQSANAAQVKLSGTLEVVSIKNGSAPVSARMAVLDGELALRDRNAWTGASGKVEVGLKSFDSDNPLRDERVQNILLQAGVFPTATFELTGVSGLAGDGIEVGGSGNAALAGNVTLAGATQAIQAPVSIQRDGEETWTIRSNEPVAVSLKGFGLGEQAEALRAECAHESIDDVVKVGFQLVASRADPVPTTPEPSEETP